MTLHIRRARPDERELLSGLAVSSKRVWGYDDDFIAATQDDLIVTLGHIENNDCFVAEQDSEIVGFYTVSDGDLDHFFVTPNRLRQGIGRTLFQHAAGRDPSRPLRIVADPSAAPFYERMGAKKVGDEESPFIAGRKLPVLEYAAGG